MKKLLIYLKAYRKEACLAPIFKMLEAVCSACYQGNYRLRYCSRRPRILSSHGTAAFTACRNRSCNGNYSAVVFCKSGSRLCSEN